MDTVWLPEALLAGSGTEETDEAQLGENTLGGEGEEAVTGVVGLLACDGVGGILGVHEVPVHDGADLLGVLFIHPGPQFSPAQGRAGRGSGVVV